MLYHELSTAKVTILSNQVHVDGHRKRTRSGGEVWIESYVRKPKLQPKMEVKIEKSVHVTISIE